MNLEFSEDQKFVQQTARDYLDEHCQLDVCRAVLESDQTYAPDLWKGVAEMGWLGTAIPEEYGGAGLGHLELALIGMETGPRPGPDPVFVVGLPRHRGHRSALAAKTRRRSGCRCLASGEADRNASPWPKASATSIRATPSTSFDGSALITGTKVPVAGWRERANLAVVVAKEGNGHSLVLVDLSGHPA